MRHYELIIMIHPDNQTDQIITMINKYKQTILNGNGVIHRLENWGRRQLAYPIKKFIKAYYICMNIEADNAVLNELDHSLRFNDLILRYVVINKKAAVTESSMYMSDEKSKSML